MSEGLFFYTEPFDHQRRLVEERWDKEYWGLFLEMGTGKSKIVIDHFVNLYLAGQVDTVFYVAKKGELANFLADQVPKHLAPDIPTKTLTYTGYSTKRQKASLEHILTPKEGVLRIFAQNIESVRSGKGYQIAKAYVKSSKKVMIVCDESTYAKDPRSSQTKALTAIARMCKYRRIMTGTLVPHTAVDIYSQSRVLSKTTFDGEGVVSFRNRYCVMEEKRFHGRSFKVITGSKNQDALKMKMKQWSDTLLKKDCLDLPEKMPPQKKLVPLTSQQFDLYQALVHTHVAMMPDGEMIDVANALALMTKLCQVVVGQVRMEDGSYKDVPSYRPEYTVNLAKDIIDGGNKVVVWSHYRHCTEVLAEQFRSEKVNFTQVKSIMGVEERQQAVEDFQNLDEVKVFLGNPQVSGFGTTLTAARYMIYHSHSDNYEHRLQSEDRIHRIGQTGACTYYDMVSKVPAELNILERSKNKAVFRQTMMSRDEMMELVAIRDPGDSYLTD